MAKQSRVRTQKILSAKRRRELAALAARRTKTKSKSTEETK